MDKVYQVFVSSTFSDLEFERKQVSDTLAKSGFIPSGMELFPATDQQQLEFIKRIIDRSDYYVVIVAARYGSLDGEKSFTEKEFEYALEKKIPVLAFIHKDPGKIESEKTEKDPEQIQRLESFISRLKTSRIVAFWTNANDLRTEVLTAVTNAVNLSPGIGWIRGDQAIDPKVLQEMERLRIENDEIKKRLLALNADEITFPSDLLGPNDKLEFKIHVAEYLDVNSYPRTPTNERHELFTVTISELFVRLYDSIITEVAEGKLSSIITNTVLAIHNVSKPKNVTYNGLRVDVEKLRFHLEALGLIQAIGGISATGSRYISWTITDKGRRYVAKIRGLKRDDPNSPSLTHLLISPT